MRNVIFLMLISVSMWQACGKQEMAKEKLSADSMLQAKQDSTPQQRSRVVEAEEVLPQVVTTNDGALPTSEATETNTFIGDSTVSQPANSQELSPSNNTTLMDKPSEPATLAPNNTPLTATVAPTTPAKPARVEPSLQPEQDESNPVLSHAAFDQLLKRHVTEDGRVNYMGFLKDKPQFEAYLNVLTKNPVQANWERNKKLAYWINAYNAFTIKRVIEKYPIHNIKNDINPWKEKTIRLGAENYSLDQIENEIIRPQFKDPRIHFALNCAAKSCPKLLNEAYMPDKIDVQLNKQADSFINNTMQNTISEKKAEISKIFEWYANDFGSLVPFLNQYLQTPLKENAKITYKEYNWSLNE